MATDIKHLLDAIIDGDSSVSGAEKFVTASDKPLNAQMGHVNFNANDFREKISLCVLKDLITAMMADDTSDMGDMIDDSIIRHIHNDYNDTCFGYLCKSRDRLNSPILGDIIQEIEDTTDNVEKEVEDTHSISNADPEKKTEDILKNIKDYDELRQALKDEVSKKVIADVTQVITRSNDAPVFDNIDKKINKTDTTTESVILKMTGNIVTEAAISGTKMSTEDGMKQAITTYCLGELDALFKADVTRTIVRKYL